MALGKDGWIRLVEVVNSSGSPVVPQTDAWASGVKTVAAPGTAEQLGSLTAPVGLAIIVKAMSSNEELVFIGNSKANAEGATTRVSLAAGQAVVLYIDDSDLVWVDAVTAGEGVEYFVEQP